MNNISLIYKYFYFARRNGHVLFASVVADLASGVDEPLNFYYNFSVHSETTAPCALLRNLSLLFTCVSETRHPSEHWGGW